MLFFHFCAIVAGVVVVDTIVVNADLTRVCGVEAVVTSVLVEFDIFVPTLIIAIAILGVVGYVGITLAIVYVGVLADKERVNNGCCFSINLKD